VWVREGREPWKTVGAATLVGGGLLVASALAPWTHFTDRVHLGDVRHYHTLAEKILHGSVPYHELFVEYPPGALGIFLLPTLAGHSAGTYGITFRVGIAVVTLVGIAGVAATLVRLGADRVRPLAAAAFLGVSPALLGSVFFDRYDVWAAVLTSLALYALFVDRPQTSAALLGVGAATKVYPGLLLPLVLIRVLGRSGVHAAVRCAVVAGAVLAVMIGPFAAIGAGGVAFSFKSQMTRVVEIESITGAVLLCLHRLGAYHPKVYAGLSYELLGSLPHALGILQTLVLFAAIVFAWWAFLVSEQSDDDLVLAAAAIVTVTVAFNKVLSPQYLVWLVPLVVLLWGRLGVIAWSLLAAAMALTVAYFPNRFHDLRVGGGTAWLVLARDAVLVVLAGILLGALGRRALGHAEPRVGAR
jgi:hypothetical protein